MRRHGRDPALGHLVGNAIVEVEAGRYFEQAVLDRVDTGGDGATDALGGVCVCGHGQPARTRLLDARDEFVR